MTRGEAIFEGIIIFALFLVIAFAIGAIGEMGTAV